MEHIEDKSIDMILTDPPYGVLALEWDKKPDLEKLWSQYNRIIKDNGAVVITANIKFAIELIEVNKKNFRYDLIWQKTMPVGFANSKRMPLREHELILVFYKKLPTYNPQGLVEIKGGKVVRNNFTSKEYVYKMSSLDKPYIQKYKNYPRSILKFSNKNHKNIHPTQKPIDLFTYLILTYSNEGDLILDSYMGSGTTALACIKTKRNYIGFEMKKEYYKRANERINNYKDMEDIKNE